MREGIGQRAIVVFGRNVNGFGFSSQLPFVFRLNKALPNNEAKAITFL